MLKTVYIYEKERGIERCVISLLYWRNGTSVLKDVRDPITRSESRKGLKLKFDKSKNKYNTEEDQEHIVHISYRCCHITSKTDLDVKRGKKRTVKGNTVSAEKGPDVENETPYIRVPKK